MKIKERNRCARCMQELNEGDTFCTNCGYDQRQNNPERALPAGTLLNDKYLIGAVIGEGGFGITYAAWDTLIETRIAIKEYFPSELVTRDTTLSGERAAHNLTLIQEKTGEGRYREGLERFVKEAGNLAKFQKEPGVVSVKDFFYENNTAYMGMEYIEGVTLNTYLGNHNGKLGTQEAFRMIEPVMKTLEAIHKEGVIHRDISPDNIMVTEDGQMKLIDFGAARFVGVDDEKSLTVILKHGYAPEEQYRSNGEQGTWTDVYALSVVIYRMLTGKAPEETLKRMTGGQDDVRAELKRVPGLSAAERRGLERGLAVKAEKRFQTVGDFYEGIYEKKQDIRKWAAGAGIVAAVVLCVIVVGVKNRDVEETAAETGNTQEEKFDNDLEFVEETEETAEEEEPEKIEETAEVEEELEDYQRIQEQKEVFEEASKIAENSEETLLDYAAVYDEDNRCVFGVTEKVKAPNSNAIGTYSVWASHDGMMEKLESFDPWEEFDWHYEGIWESKIFQFGKTQHYILELSGAEQWIQHKFCYEDGIARKADDSLYFETDENGKVKMLISGYPNTAIEYGSEPSASNGILYVTTLVDVFYYDHQYVEYGAEEVDISVLEQYENYREILQEAEENLLKVRYIAQPQEGIEYEKIEKAELIYIRKAVNGTYYLNYKLYGKMDEGNYDVYGNAREVAEEPDTDGNYENTVWAYVVLEATGNHLEIENQYSGEKGEQSETGLAIYYGPDRELQAASRSKNELRALIEERSGKNVVAGSRGCYGDYDGNGKYELFAFVADSYSPYLNNAALRSENRDYIEEQATGCALWFSDGEQTVQVAELADGYWELSMDILQFGESTQCVLTRLLPDKYSSVDEILSVGGYATTVCVLEDGIPRVIMLDENMRFYQKEDSREIGYYGLYGTWREDDSVVYRNGSYYWESDMAPVTENMNYRMILSSIELGVKETELVMRNIIGESSGWYSAYQEFILNKEYLTSGQEYGSDWGECDPIVSLYDFDKDGISELLITNGYSARTNRWAYIYTCKNNEVKYLDIGPTDAFYIEDSEYSGIWGYYGGGEDNWTYYWKDNDEIGSEYVCQEYFDWNLNDNIAIQQTSNDKLFTESQKEKTLLPGAAVSEIESMGWDKFIVLTGIGGKEHVNH